MRRRVRTTLISVACIGISLQGQCESEPDPPTPPMISIDFSDSHLADVVKSLAHAAEIDVDTDVIKQGTVNLKWGEVSAREALDMVLKMNLLVLQETDGNYQIISTIEGENPVLMDPPPPTPSPSPTRSVIAYVTQEYHEQVMREWQAKGLTRKLHGVASTAPIAPPDFESSDSSP